jgi:hypothetical protein
MVMRPLEIFTGGVALAVGDNVFYGGQVPSPVRGASVTRPATAF